MEAANSPPADVAPLKTVPLLIRALNDEDELVRTCAADSLGEFLCDEARHALRARVRKERNALARGYALKSLGRIGALGDLAYICTELSSDSTEEGRNFGAHGLFLGVRRVAIEVLLPILNAHHLPLRVGACRTLADVCSGSADARAIAAMRSRIKRETGSTVVDMKRELQDIIANRGVSRAGINNGRHLRKLSGKRRSQKSVSKPRQG
jgi:hypothetical protein